MFQGELFPLLTNTPRGTYINLECPQGLTHSRPKPALKAPKREERVKLKFGNQEEEVNLKFASRIVKQRKRHLQW